MTQLLVAFLNAVRIDGWIKIFTMHASMDINVMNYCFMSRSRFFHLCGEVTIIGEGLQNLSLCSALRVFG
jgi:hypothetical protein